MKVPMERCQRNLATLWFVGGGILLILLVVQTLGNHYLDKDNEAWGWLLPNLLPTLSLIIGVVMANIFGGGSKGKQVDTFVYRLAVAVSVIYLLLVLLPIVAQPVVSYAPLDLLKRSNLWLGPLQGLVSATIGAFFVKAEK